MTTYAERSGQHDKIAIPLVCDELIRLGLATYTTGVERDDPALRQQLQQQYDPQAIMLRYRPDITGFVPGVRTIQIEVKSEKNGWRNFSIEADSYAGGLQWSTTGSRVLYAFVDLQTATIFACWCEAIPQPDEIQVPRHHPNARENYARMCARWPNVDIAWTDSNGGSGTPFFLISKRAAYLTTIANALGIIPPPPKGTVQQLGLFE